MLKYLKYNNFKLQFGFWLLRMKIMALNCKLMLRIEKHTEAVFESERAFKLT